MSAVDRLIDAEPLEDDPQERAMRPQTLADYQGQPVVSEQMEIFIGAARSRSESLDHLLIFGPPGLGKTTLANIVANELDVNIRHTSGPVIERAGDLAALLTNLEKNDVLFIDEIHRLNAAVEEVLYPAMEDFQLDIMIGEGPAARSIKIIKGDGSIDQAIANAALNMLNVDELGLDNMDRRLLFAIIEKFDGGPVGLDNLGAAIGEETGTIEEVIEPYLIQQGFLMRTPRGRTVTKAACEHLRLPAPVVSSNDLFD